MTSKASSKSMPQFDFFVVDNNGSSILVSCESFTAA